MGLGSLFLSILLVASGGPSTQGSSLPESSASLGFVLGFSGGSAAEQSLMARLVIVGPEGFRVEREVEVPGRISLDLPVGKALRASMAAPGWWSQDRTLPATSGAEGDAGAIHEASVLLLRPAGTMSGSLSIETRLVEPLILEPRVSLEVLLDPALDSYQRPWKLELSRLSGVRPMSYTAKRATADRQGRLQISGLAQGAYRLRVHNHRDDFRLETEVELAPGDSPLRLFVPLIHIDGILTQSGERISGHLWFGRRNGAEKSHLFAGQDGRFHGFLAREGSWPVEVQPVSRSTTTTLEAVEVMIDPETDKAFVELRLPNTRLGGRVIDPSGAPVIEAAVSALSIKERRPAASAFSDSLGRFEFSGLAPGNLLLSARFESEDSDPIAVHLEPGAIQKDIILQIGIGLRVSGQVYSTFGPVPRARILVSPRVPLGTTTVFRGGLQRTGPEGEFELVLPRQTESVDLLVMAPGYAAKMLQTPLTAGVPLMIPLDVVAGELEIGVPEAGASLAEWVLENQEGARFPLADFRLWTETHGGSRSVSDALVLPKLEPGAYALCPARQKSTGRCTSGFLPANGTLRLSVEMEETGEE